MRNNNPVRIIFAIAISFLMTLATTSVVATVYKIDLDYWNFSVLIVVLISLFTILNMNKRKWLGYAGLGVVLAFTGICVFRDFFNMRTSVVEVYTYILSKFDVGTNFYEFTVSAADISVVFALASTLALFFTIRMAINKKTLIGSIVWYLIVFGLAMLISGKRVNPNWIMVIAFCFLMMFIYECMRKTNGVVLETTIAYVVVPVFLFCLVTRFVFPYKYYNMQEVADEQYDFVLTTIDDTLGTNLKRYLDRKVKFYDPQEEIANSAQIQINKTDMRNVGKQADKNVEMMLVQLALKDDAYFSDYSKIYMKAGTKTIYNGSVWYLDNDWRDYAVAPTDINSSEWDDSFSNAADVLLAVDIVGNRNYTFRYTPNKIGSAMYEGKLENPLSERYYLDPSLSEYNGYTSNMDFSKAYRFSLVGPGELTDVPEFDKDYLDYVYSNMVLETIGTSYNRIVDFMPEWYRQVYKGEIKLTDAEKVAAVMNYLYHTKSYDVNVDFMPDDEDFVEWFISSCESGYCVHFATTAAVLLKMLGVPTRYVTGYMISEPATKYERDITQYSITNHATQPEYDTYEVNSETSHFYVYEYIVMDSDAHAWCEYFDPEYGWIGFDPTSNSFVPDTKGFVPPKDPFATEYTGEIVHNFTPVHQTIVEREDLEKEEDNQEDELEQIAKEETFIFCCWMTAIAAFVAFILVRLVDIVLWKRKFNKGSNNVRGRAMCRYCLVLQDHNEITVPSDIMELTDYAMYRREGLTDDELKKLHKLCKEHSKRVMKNNKWWKVIQLRVVYQEFL